MLPSVNRGMKSHWQLMAQLAQPISIHQNSQILWYEWARKGFPNSWTHKNIRIRMIHYPPSLEVFCFLNPERAHLSSCCTVEESPPKRFEPQPGCGIDSAHRKKWRFLETDFSTITGWWLNQPIWKTLVHLEIFPVPQVGVKIKKMFNHHLDHLGNFYPPVKLKNFHPLKKNRCLVEKTIFWKWSLRKQVGFSFQQKFGGINLRGSQLRLGHSTYRNWFSGILLSDFWRKTEAFPLPETNSQRSWKNHWLLLLWTSGNLGGVFFWPIFQGAKTGAI